MSPTEPVQQNNSKRATSRTPSAFRKFGYVVVIAIMFLILYLARNYQRWGLHFLTEDFDRYLFYLELSIYANIGAQILFLIYDNRWFKHLVQGLTDVTGALSVIMFYVIYPLNLADATWDKWIRIGLLVIFVFTAISILVNLIKGIRYLVREPETV